MAGPLANVGHVAEWAAKAATDKDAERLLRIFVEEVAKDCPLYVLALLGQCIVACRAAELRKEQN